LWAIDGVFLQVVQKVAKLQLRNSRNYVRQTTNGATTLGCMKKQPQEFMNNPNAARFCPLGVLSPSGIY